MRTMTCEKFSGAKIALFIGGRLAIILRDDLPDIPYPGHWDLPGGGREGDETPLSCALRETREELGLIVPEGSVRWARGFDSAASDRTWFCAAHLPGRAAREIVFGNEGQRWELVDPDIYLHARLNIPHLAERLSTYLNSDIYKSH